MKQKMPRIENEKVVVDKYKHKPENDSKFNMDMLKIVTALFILTAIFGVGVFLFFAFDFHPSKSIQTTEVQLHEEPTRANYTTQPQILNDGVDIGNGNVVVNGTSTQNTPPKTDNSFLIMFGAIALILFINGPGRRHRY